MAEETTLTSESTTNWRDALPDDIKESGALQDIKDINTLAKSYVDAQSFIGRSIRIPGDDASDDVKNDFREKLTKVPGVGYIPTSESSEEEWGQFYGTLGRPDTADDYKMPQRDDLAGDPDVDKRLLGEMHKLGLTNNQATGLMGYLNDGQANMQANIAANMESASNTLKEEWGQAYDRKLQEARNALQAYAEPEFVEMLNSTGLGDSPHMIKAFAKIGENLSEDVAKNLGEGAQGGMTPAEAIQQIADIRGNSNHPFNDPSNPSHNHEAERMAQLYQAAYGANDADPDMFEQAFRSAG